MRSKAPNIIGTREGERANAPPHPPEARLIAQGKARRLTSQPRFIVSLHTPIPTFLLSHSRYSKEERSTIPQSPTNGGSSSKTKKSTIQPHKNHDGGVTVVGGEVASGEGAYGEFLGALGLSLLGRLAGAGGQERDPCGEEQEAKARDGKVSMSHDSCGVVLLVCLLMKSAPQVGLSKGTSRNFVPAGDAGQVGRVEFCKDTPILSSQCKPSGFSLGYEPRFGWTWGRGICPLSLARTYYIRSFLY